MRYPSAPATLTLFATSIALVTLLAAPATATADETGWPGLRGPGHDGAVRDATAFGGEIRGLEIAWKRPLGAGYPVVVGDGERLVVAFQGEESDLVAAFDPASGDELWRYALAAKHSGHTGSHDGPIATPALGGGRVFALGPSGHLVALDADDGKLVWSKHLADDLGSEPPFYGFASSPLVAGEVVVVQIGAGEGKSVAGFAAATGELLWSAADDPIHYHSPILATLGGREQVLAAGSTHLTGLDPASGAVLWSHEHGGDERAMGGATIVPLPAGGNRVLLLHRQGESVMLEIDGGEDGDWTIAELWTGKGIKSTYVQPVYHDGHLYGMNNRIFTCVDAATGETVWRDREPGDGFPTLIGDRLAIMSKPGVLRLAEATPEGYRELASLALFDEVSWSAPAMVGDHLFVRSMGSLARVDAIAAVAASAEPATVEAASAATGEAPGRMTTAATASVLGRFLAGLDEAEDKSSRIDAFLAANAPLPVVEHTGEVHFLWRGEATDVGIIGDMIGFRREDPMTRVPGTDLFHYTTRLEPDAAVHYGFLVDYAGEATPDPLNPRRSEGLFGETSFFEMPARRARGFDDEARPARAGRIEELSFESAAFEGKTRAAKVYLPAGYDPEDEARYPTLYVLEGHEALEKGGFQGALDHLIGESVRPLIAVFVLPDPEADRGELRNPAYAKMVVEELVARVGERFRTIDHPMARAVAGVAGGGDLSLTLGFTGDVFARVGAIWPMLFAYDTEPPSAADKPLVLYQKWGTYHLRSPHENFDSAAANREMFQRLRGLGHRPAGGEVPEGFGWACWKAHVGEMLTALFPAG